MKIKNILKIFAFIITIKASFLVSFGFVGEDLGLDLYKKIDKGIISLEEKLYTSKIKGKSIISTVNLMLKNKGLGHCKIKDDKGNESKIVTLIKNIKNNTVTEEEIGTLTGMINPECSNIITFSSIEENLKFLDVINKKESGEEAENISNISRINLYSDGSLENSPFDLVNDIREIDNIIFSSKIEYNYGHNIGDKEIDKYIKFLEKSKNFLEKKLNKKISNPINKVIQKLVGDKEEEKTYKGFIERKGDNTRYTCPVDESESGLSKEEFKKILDENSDIIKTGKKEAIGLNNNLDNFGSKSPNSNKGKNNNSYKGVNDNDFWECDNYFCITVEFITHKGQLFGSSKTMHTIQDLVERSNQHIKKFANGSLTQYNMTTGNFEISSKNIKLNKSFSFGMVVTKKSPPILNIEKYKKTATKSKTNKKSSKNTNTPLGFRNLLKMRFEGVGIKYFEKNNKENDLNLYIDESGKVINLSIAAGKKISGVTKTLEERVNSQKEVELLNLHINNIINSESNNSSTQGLFKEFIEFERFTSIVQGYVNNLENITNVMQEIPSK